MLNPNNTIVFQPEMAQVVELNNGLMPITQIGVGDVVFNKWGQQIKVEQLYKQNCNVLKLTFKDNSFMYVADNFHLLKYSAGSSVLLNANTDLKPRQTNGNFNFCNVRCKPIDFQNNISGLCSPYVLGAFLGDGIVINDPRSKTKRFKPALMLASGTDEIPNKISEILGGYWRSTKACTYEFYLPKEQQKPKHKKHSRYDVFNNVEGVNVYCGEKFIDSKFLYSGVENRVELLKGLMDTDGTVGNGCLYYSTKSEQLAKDIQVLSWGLGYRCNIHRQESRNSFQLYFSVPAEERKKLVSESSRLNRLFKTNGGCDKNTVVGIESLGEFGCIGIKTGSLVVDSFNVAW